MDDDKKIPFITGSLILFLCLFIDVLDILLDLLVGIGIILNPIIQILNFILIQIYLTIKNIKGMFWLAGTAIDMIPILDVLPVTTATWLLTIILTNNPKAAELANKIPIKK